MCKTSCLVQECRTSLNEMARHSNLTLEWVRGHGSNSGNEIADDLAKRGTTLREDEIDSFCGVPLSACWSRISLSFSRLAQEKWFSEPTCQVSRNLWPQIDRRRTGELIRMHRPHMRIIISVITGHCPFGNHARRLGLPYNDFCRSCRDEEEEETISHLLCDCPALENERLRYLGRRSFNSLLELTTVELSALLSFVRSSGWLYLFEQ